MFVVMLLLPYLFHRSLQIQFHFYVSVWFDPDKPVLRSGSSQERDLDLRVDEGHEEPVVETVQGSVDPIVLKIVYQKDRHNDQKYPSGLQSIYHLNILTHLSIHPIAQNIPTMKIRRNPTGRKKLK